MSQAKVDRLYMAAAVRLAERGLFSVTRNNPRVGCLVVNDFKVVGRGWHEKDGGAHAEVNALAQAGKHARGGTVYVSLEPCGFEGRTPACTEMLHEAGIKHVVVGAYDPHPRVRGNGVQQLKSLGLTVKVMGLEKPGNLNPGIYRRYSFARPYVRIKSAISVDGRTAMADGESQWITGSQARRDSHYWRARSGAIITGIGTVLRDDPLLTVREKAYQGCPPWRIVMDSRGRFPVNAKMLSDPSRVIVVCGRDAHGLDIAAQVDTWHETAATPEVSAVLQRLANEGVNEVLVEAGSELTGSFLSSGLWDELIAYVAPKFMGSAARALGSFHIESLAGSIAAELVSATPLGPDVRLRFRKAANVSKSIE